VTPTNQDPEYSRNDAGRRHPGGPQPGRPEARSAPACWGGPRSRERALADPGFSCTAKWQLPPSRPVIGVRSAPLRLRTQAQLPMSDERSQPPRNSGLSREGTRRSNRRSQAATTESCRLSVIPLSPSSTVRLRTKVTKGPGSFLLIPFGVAGS